MTRRFAIIIAISALAPTLAPAHGAEDFTNHTLQGDCRLLAQVIKAENLHQGYLLPGSFGTTCTGPDFGLNTAIASPVAGVGYFFNPPGYWGDNRAVTISYTRMTHQSDRTSITDARQCTFTIPYHDADWKLIECGLPHMP